MSRFESVGTDGLRRRIADQRQWIADHGGSEAGYVATYGSTQDAPASDGGKRYGDGGEAIYAADMAHLRQLEDRLAYVLSPKRDARYWCPPCRKHHNGTSAVGADHWQRARV